MIDAVAELEGINDPEAIAQDVINAAWSEFMPEGKHGGYQIPLKTVLNATNTDPYILVKDGKFINIDIFDADRWFEWGVTHYADVENIITTKQLR